MPPIVQITIASVDPLTRYKQKLEVSRKFGADGLRIYSILEKTTSIDEIMREAQPISEEKVYRILDFMGRLGLITISGIPEQFSERKSEEGALLQVTATDSLARFRHQKLLFKSFSSAGIKVYELLHKKPATVEEVSSALGIEPKRVQEIFDFMLANQMAENLRAEMPKKEATVQPTQKAGPEIQPPAAKVAPPGAREEVPARPPEQILPVEKKEELPPAAPAPPAVREEVPKAPPLQAVDQSADYRIVDAPISDKYRMQKDMLDRFGADGLRIYSILTVHASPKRASELAGIPPERVNEIMGYMLQAKYIAPYVPPQPVEEKPPVRKETPREEEEEIKPHIEEEIPAERPKEKAPPKVGVGREEEIAAGRPAPKPEERPVEKAAPKIAHEEEKPAQPQPSAKAEEEEEIRPHIEEEEIAPPAIKEEITEKSAKEEALPEEKEEEMLAHAEEEEELKPAKEEIAPPEEEEKELPEAEEEEEKGLVVGEEEEGEEEEEKGGAGEEEEEERLEAEEAHEAGEEEPFGIGEEGEEEETEEEGLSEFEELIQKEFGDKGVMAYRLIDGRRTAEQIMNEAGVDEELIIKLFEFLEAKGIIRLERPKQHRVLEEEEEEKAPPMREAGAITQPLSETIERPRKQIIIRDLVPLDVPILQKLPLPARMSLEAKLLAKFGAKSLRLLSKIDNESDVVKLSLEHGIDLNELDEILYSVSNSGGCTFATLSEDDIRRRYGAEALSIYKKYGRDGVILYALIGKMDSIRKMVDFSKVDRKKAIEIILEINELLGIEGVSRKDLAAELGL
ncbi:MAG: hypothetical protein QXU54_01860 [Candidatus Micrarchaeia archaeon]